MEKLEVRFEKVSVLKRVVDLFKELVPFTDFSFSPEGLFVQGTDTSITVFVKLSLPAKGFDLYRCERNFALGVNLNSFALILKCVAPDDFIKVMTNLSSDTVSFLVENPSIPDKSRNFEMKLMQIEVDYIDIPEMDYHAVVTMPSNKFAKLCGDLNSIGHTVEITVTREGIKFFTRGDFMKADILYTPSTKVDKPEEAIIIEVNEPISLKFPVKYLAAFTKATPLSNTVTINVFPNHPLVVEYKIADHPMGYIKYYLAPKEEIEENMFHLV